MTIAKSKRNSSNGAVGSKASKNSQRLPNKVGQPSFSKKDTSRNAQEVNDGMKRESDESNRFSRTRANDERSNRHDSVHESYERREPRNDSNSQSRQANERAAGFSEQGDQEFNGSSGCRSNLDTYGDRDESGQRFARMDSDNTCSERSRNGTSSRQRAEDNDWKYSSSSQNDWRYRDEENNDEQDSRNDGRRFLVRPNRDNGHENGHDNSDRNPSHNGANGRFNDGGSREESPNYRDSNGNRSLNSRLNGKNDRREGRDENNRSGSNSRY
jgi:hypothetical protein